MCENSFPPKNVFDSSFCEGAVKCKVKADQGSDINLVPPSVLRDILKHDDSVLVEELRNPRSYGTVVKGGQQVTCNKKFRTTIYIQVRHGSDLVLRGVEWLVSEQETEYVLLGEPVLRALGLDNEELLAAVCDRHGGVVCVPELIEKLKEDKNIQNSDSGEVKSLINAMTKTFGTTFHSDCGTEEDMLEDSDVYVDVGEDSPEELGMALSERLSEARKSGLSDLGSQKLKSIIDKHKQVFD